MIEFENLAIGYSTRGKETIVASDISATLPGGCLTCLIGANGIGKSTLLRTLCTFQKPLAGHIYISCGEAGQRKDMAQMSDKELSRLIGVVLTERLDVQNMTVREIVALGRSPYTGFWGSLDEHDQDIVDESMALVGIEGIAGRQIQNISDGERQKMMIAKALAQQTPVIVLDEPTAFLDYPSKVGTMKLLRSLSHDTGKTIFLSTHDLEIAMQTADNIWLMADDGRIHAGTPRQLAQDGSLSAFLDCNGMSFDKETMTIKC